jgi:hypothetical protein
MKDFQFEHEHFHLFESAEALLHFCSINLRQIVRLKGFAHTSCTRRQPYQGRDRQRIPRLNREIPKPAQRPTWWRTGGDRR